VKKSLKNYWSQYKMGLFSRKKKQEPKVKKDKGEDKLIIGINPQLVNKVKNKVKKLKEEKEILRSDYHELIKKMSAVEGKTNAIDSTFKSFRKDLMTGFMEEARKTLKKEMKGTNDSIANNHSRVMKLENEVLKLSKTHDEFEFVSSFQDYYQLIKLCIYMITNAEPEQQTIIMLVLQTIHSLVDDMRRNGFWDAGKDAIITSLLNLKTYWRSKDERIENLIGAEVDALETLR